MPIKSLNPYVILDGTAAKAIQHYERTLGAKVEVLQHFSEVPGMSVEPAHGQRIIHAQLRLGDSVLMLSDTDPKMPVPVGTNTSVCLQLEDVADTRAKFDALAAGGKVTMPLADTFWGATFGMLTDAYGVQWMFNCQKGA